MYDQFKEYGVVEAVYHPVVYVSGLPNVQPRELVIFENNVQGQVLRLHIDRVEVLLFSHHPVRVGLHVTRTGEQFTIALGDYLLGAVVDPLAIPLIARQEQTTTLTTAVEVSEIERLIAEQSTERRPIDSSPPSILIRKNIRRQLITGVTLVDNLLPLGMGQRELVVGDRKTGKTTFALSAIRGHVKNGGKAIYAAVGKKLNELEQVREYLATEKILDQVVVVGSTAQDASSLVFMTPYTAVTIAEYLMDQGNDILVVLDDLSTHAKYYREISLQAKQFPGRDSYPGDVFFTHARLLERAGNFTHQAGERSLTILPIAETVENDLTDYIVSNLIGITDGHLQFDTNEFIRGRRPAVNVSLSVTRVGKQTQNKLQQDVNRALLAFMNSYQKSVAFSHFGTELSAEIRQIIQTGNAIYDLFNQSAKDSIVRQVQIVLLGLIWIDRGSRLADMISIQRARNNLNTSYTQEQTTQELVAQILQAETWEQLTTNVDKVSPQLYKLCLA